MQFAQPELNKLQEKYQGKTDEASKRAMQLETMKIYKKYDINPLGCFLPFLQLPIFIAMYQAVRRIPLTDTYVNNPDLNFNFFGLDLLSIPEEGFNIAANWPFLLFALIVGLTMFFSQRYSMKKPEFAKNKKYETTVQNQTQNTMKYMTYFLTFMIMTVAYTSLGIAYYWVIGNGFQFLQTYVNRRKTAMKMEKMKEVA
jgi:YidC/Oxa1 family membrane protein insertase